MIALVAGDADRPKPETFRESFLDILRARFGPLPADIEEWVTDELGVELRHHWLKAACLCTSLDDLRARIGR